MAQQPPLYVVHQVLPELVRFLLLLTHTRVGPTLQVTSWWRSFADNRRVGGAERSQHLLGLAIDVAGNRADLEAFAQSANAVGLVALDYGGHVHVQARTAGTFDSVIGA